MKSSILIVILMVISTVFTGCRRSSDEVLDDTRTATRHLGRGFRSLGGKQGDSRQVCSPDEFGFGQSIEYDEMAFIPLEDEERVHSDMNVRQPRHFPGENNSPIPGINAFQDPEDMPGLSGVFDRIHFGYNNSAVKGADNQNTIQMIASYMQSHPNTYLFIEGHCDERGAEAYNLSLGVKRSNAVRNALAKEGVDPDHLFTVSYGKERPLTIGHDESAWKENRRAEFKIYER